MDGIDAVSLVLAIIIGAVLAWVLGGLLRWILGIILDVDFDNDDTTDIL